MHGRIIRRTALLVMATGLSGCSNGPEALLADYAARMSRVLDQPVSVQARPVLPAFPRGRDQTIDQPDVRLGLREAWAVRDCLGQLIALRNSGLGRVMQPSQRLVYESQFHAQAVLCLQDLAVADDADEQAQAQRASLQAIVASKAGAVRAAVKALVLRDAQMEQFWRLPAKPMGHDAPPVRGDALEQIADKVELALDGQALNSAELESALSQLQGSTGLGNIAQAEALALVGLRAVTATIHARLDRLPVCHQQQATPDARVLQTIFHKVYTGRVQPWLAEVQRAAQAARPPAQRALAPLAGEFGPGMRAYYEQIVLDTEGSLSAAFVQAARAHSEAWQRLLGQCGMMPAR